MNIKQSVFRLRFYCLLVLFLIQSSFFVPVFSKESPLLLHSRKRIEKEEGIRLQYRELKWSAAQTAVIICDMWNEHWCRGATRRVAELAPRVNEFVKKARKMGILIVHAPSGTMDYYKNNVARKRAQDAPKAANLPRAIGSWSTLLKSEKNAKWPVDQSDGGCDCRPKCKTRKAWTRQVKTIEIKPGDAISDSGIEIWNLFEDRGIKNVMLLGVHTNMCVIGRPFGLRNMVKFGKNVVLVRDLTDTMYNSRMRPFVNHFTGTDLVVHYIERYVCPTITSRDLTGRKPFRFKNDKRRRIVFLSAESEYKCAFTFPRIAHELELKYGFCCSILQGSTEKRGDMRNDIPCMYSLEDADLAFLFVRRRALPEKKMQYLKNYLSSGKPLIAFRTASHAFAPKGDLAPGLVKWPGFDREVLGCNYNYYPHGGARVSVAPAAFNHPIVKGLKGPYFLKETIYRHLPLASTCRVLLTARCVSIEGADKRYQKENPAKEIPDQPVAWTNSYHGARIFYSTFGSFRAAFKKDWFNRMIINAVFWALDMKPPAQNS